MREGVCVQVLQRQASEVHALRGPGRQEVPLSPLQQILREEGQIKDPHFTRSRKTQASQGTETCARSCLLQGVHIIPIVQSIASLHHCITQLSRCVRAKVCVVLKEQLPAASLRNGCFRFLLGLYMQITVIYPYS